jgi:hypothetical protein
MKVFIKAISEVGGGVSRASHKLFEQRGVFGNGGGVLP